MDLLDRRFIMNCNLLGVSTMKQFTVVLVILLAVSSAFAVEVRIKDISYIPEVASNQLFGYGVVIGLPGTGDSSRLLAARQALSNMLINMDIRLSPEAIRSDNIAAVMATAELPAFAKEGDRIDVRISSIGDAESMEGGTLLLTPLRAADGKVYASSQGTITVDKRPLAPGARRRNETLPPVGKIVGGALIAKTLDTKFEDMNSLSIRLRNPDFATASLVAKKINETFWDGIAIAVDLGTVKVEVPKDFKKRLVNFVSMLGELTVNPDTKAKVVINERTGTVIIGEKVRISTFAISHGNMTLKISQMPNGKATLDDVVTALKAVGTTTEDLIAILKTMKAAGALQAELIIM